jgi:uncharacterized protein YbjT (DUF2867 family)
MGDTRKILVLGASGLIGRFVTDELRAGFCGGRNRAAIFGVAEIRLA